VELAQAVTLLTATLMTGLVAGLLFTFAQAVMPGLARSGDVGFVAGFQAIDAAIDNPWQGVSFAGAPVFTVLALVLQLIGGGGSTAFWVLAALVLLGAALVITFRVHLPLNAAIQAVGEPDRVDDLAAVRHSFESRWVRWNVVRAALSTAAFACLAWSLVLFGGR
jgi:uncharacterized membrane protein